MEYSLKYHTQQCVDWINNNQFQKVGLQFPEHLLHDSRKVFKDISAGTSCTLVILGDIKSRGCCVDEQAAKGRLDAVVHFGASCLTPSSALRVLYTLSPSLMVDSSQIIAALKQHTAATDEKLILTYDSLCSNFDETFFEELQKEFPNLLTSSFDIEKGVDILRVGVLRAGPSEIDEHLAKEDERTTVRFHARKVTLPAGDVIADYNFLHIGPNNQSLSVLKYRFPQPTFYHFDTDTSRLSAESSFKLIIKRSAKLEQIKDSEFIGILVGTLGVRDHIAIRQKLGALIQASGRRCRKYVISRINEAKLANLKEPDVIVYIDCPENTLFDRNEQPFIYRRLVTPWEVEVALNPNVQWTLDFELNFRSFLVGGAMYVEAPAMPEISNEHDADHSTEMRLSVRLPGIVSTTGRGENLANSSWQGLDPHSQAPHQIGQIVEGRKGIASGYEQENIES